MLGLAVYISIELARPPKSSNAGRIWGPQFDSEIMFKRPNGGIYRPRWYLFIRSRKNLVTFDWCDVLPHNLHVACSLQPMGCGNWQKSCGLNYLSFRVTWCVTNPPKHSSSFQILLGSAEIRPVHRRPVSHDLWYFWAIIWTQRWLIDRASLYHQKSILIR